LVIDLLASTLPFYLLRRLNPHNAPSSNPTVSSQLTTNTPIKIYVTLFAAAIYAVVVYTSLYTWLPVYLVTNFSGLPTLQRVHDATLPLILAMTLPLGFAAKDLLFTPSVYYARNAGLNKPVFNPETATLGETLAWNIGLSGWGIREDVLASRTALLLLMTFLVSYVKVYGTVQGAEMYGALGWGGVFASAGLLTGVGFAWVGDV